MAQVKKVWVGNPSRISLQYPSKEYEKLENVVYVMNIDGFGQLYLSKLSDNFSFDYKIYGLEKKLINRVLKTYEHSPYGNLGILLNGLKGTGKTVTAKILSNSLSQPTIIIPSKFDADLTGFINSIPQDVTIFIDEYEKIFGESKELLTIMDGCLNSDSRRVFILTTNNLYIDENLLQRPSRIRYLKKFENLSPEIVTDIVDDLLKHPELKDETIEFISNLEMITVDIVKAIINEVNLHSESPNEFKDVFNVKKITGKFNVYVKDYDGSYVEFATNCKIYPKPNYNDSSVGYRFEIDGNIFGRVTSVLNWTTLELTPDVEEGETVDGFEKPIIIKVEDAKMVNYTYAYSDSYQFPRNNKNGLSSLATKLKENLKVNSEKKLDFKIKLD